MDAFLRISQVLERVPFSKATLWAKVKEGSFPAPVQLNGRITAWAESELQAWAEQIIKKGPRYKPRQAENRPVEGQSKAEESRKAE